MIVPLRGVRRAKVLFSSGCESHPAALVILAGSSSSDSGDDKRVGALNDKGSFSDSASVRAVTYVNAEQAPKMGLAGADPPSLKGKAVVAADRGMTGGPTMPPSPTAVLPG